MARPLTREQRQHQLLQIISSNPLIADAQLAQELDVSVYTIRADRVALHIPELRKRMRSVALESVGVFPGNWGDLIDVEQDARGISIMEITERMLVGPSLASRSEYLFAQAQALAMAVLKPVINLGSARLRYLRPVHLHEKVVAKAIVRVRKGPLRLVSVYSRVNKDVVFRGQFIMTVAQDAPAIRSD